jgi:hypothetical protein
MFYKIKTIFNPVDCLIPIRICIIIFCLGIIFTNYAYSANEKESQKIQCIPISEKDSLLTKLKNIYGENKIFIGLSSKGTHFIELFINSDTGSWTILGTNPTKVCIFDFGMQGKIKILGQDV